MSEFSELIKNFDKIRAYMRDFYIYGFKTRSDYTVKSARTYDNERRRIESWLSPYIRREHSARGKQVFLSIDSARVLQNPLYAAWKSKSFTRSDLLLHFFLLDLLSDGQTHTVEELTDAICARYGEVFDSQTVRGKLREYTREGLLCAQKQGKALHYALGTRNLSRLSCRSQLLDAVRFFQETAPFGFVGSTILDGNDAQNDLFTFKHDFIVHTLDDQILFELLGAIRSQKTVQLDIHSRRNGKDSVLIGIPLRILVSAQSGRRYLCLYLEQIRRFHSVRLDGIHRVAVLRDAQDTAILSQKLDAALPKCWGVSFGKARRSDQIFMKLEVDEQREGFILERLRREGRGGELLRVGKNLYLYSLETFDANEVLPWIKTFLGRIVSFECTNPIVLKKFHQDVGRMYRFYCREVD